jgi:pimeloyl-ACP methyl ester carboxylesterase
VLLLAIIPLVTPSASAAEKKLPLPGEVFEVDGKTAFLILPPKDQIKAGAPVPWVWYAPTLPPYPGTAEKWMFERFLAQGIAIAGIDVGESYGSPAGQTSYTALYEELTGKRGLSKKACLLARSRGGLMLYSWAAAHSDAVACIAGIYPVCNLASYPGLAKACGAFGLTSDELEKQLATYNPIERLAPLAKAKVPIFHLHGDQDTVVPLEKNSAVVAERYEKLGGTMTLRVIEGQGHNMWAGWFESQELVDFVIAHCDRPPVNP